MSTDILIGVDEILKKADMPERHTFYQIEKFIIGKEVTVQAQLWSIVRELRARRDTIDGFKKDLKDTEDNLEMFDVKIQRMERFIRKETQNSTEDSDLNIRECEINIRKLERDKQCLIESGRKLNRKLQDITEEVDFLFKAFNRIVTQYGDMKPLDDEESQREMWNEKLLEELNLRVLLQRPLDPEFIRTIMCLHTDAPVRKQIEGMITNIQTKLIADKRALANVAKGNNG